MKGVYLELLPVEADPPVTVDGLHDAGQLPRALLGGARAAARHGRVSVAGRVRGAARARDGVRAEPQLVPHVHLQLQRDHNPDQ